MQADGWDAWFEGVWEHREETVYRKLFGTVRNGIYNVPASLFSDTFRQSPDPRWLFTGVFVSPPTQDRNSWLYVTSGLSNAWEAQPNSDHSGCSGLGVEFLFETTEDAIWPITLLHGITAYQYLAASSRLDEPRIFGVHDRIPLRSPIKPDSQSELTALILCEPLSCAPSFRLETGHVNLLECVGVSQMELTYAKEHGTDQLIEMLHKDSGFPITDPYRRSKL